MKSHYELLRHGRYILPCCLITALFLSACAEQKSEAKKKQIELATANDMPKQADREIIGKDGAKMLLTPAGDFMMGSSTEGRADEEPMHHVSWMRSIWTSTKSRTSCFRSSCVRPATRQRLRRKAGL